MKKKFSRVVKAEYGWKDPMLNNGIARGYEMQNGMPQLQPVGIQQMPIQGVNTPLQAPQQSATEGRTPTLMGSQNQGRTFTTPGTGNIIAAGIGMANALLPNQQANNYHQPQYGNYNPFSEGTGSTALYDDGGTIPTYQRKFTSPQGGIKVTEQVPTNLGYGATDVPDPSSVTPNYTHPPKAISYESLRTMGDRQVYAPKFQGMSQGEIRNQWNSIPQQINGREVLRGQAWEDLQAGPTHSPTPQALPYQPTFSNNQITVDSPGVHATSFYPQGQKQWTFEDGGKLQVGQQLTLSPAEKLKYEALGYVFK